MSAAFGTTPLPLPPAANSHSAGKAGQVWSVTYDPNSAQAADAAGMSQIQSQQYQQPVQQQIAKITAGKVTDAVHGASGIAINPRFVVYVVKQGLIRVFHRHSSGNSLMRSHSGQTISDLQFFNDGDVLASVGYCNPTGTTAHSNDADCSNRGGNVVISRIFERAASEIVTEQILEIRSGASYLTRVIWHPFNVNQFWMMHHLTTGSTNEPTGTKRTATLVESTRLSTAPHSVHHHAVADFATSTVLTEGGIVSPLDLGLMDLAWSTRDTRYVLAVYKTGDIVLLDVKNTTLQHQAVEGANGSATVVTALPAIVQRFHHGHALTRCLFLPHEHVDSSHYNRYHDSDSYQAPKQPWTTCFVTGADGNSELTLWSPFAESSSPLPLQVIRIATPSPTSYVLNFCAAPWGNAAGPFSCFMALSNCDQGSIYALHVLSASKSELQQRHPTALVLAGVDYVVPFRTQFPIYSSKSVCEPPTDLPDEEWSQSQQSRTGNMFDISIFAYQSTAVQRLTLTAQQCWPPSDASARSGVASDWIDFKNTTSSNTGVSELDDGDDFEDYDVEEDDDEEDFDGAPDPSMLPVPGNSTKPGGSVTNLQNNAFSNWLGAMAAKTTTSSPSLPQASPSPQVMLPLERPVAPTVVSPPPSRSVSAPPASFLSPMDILASPSPPPVVLATLSALEEQRVKPIQSTAETTVRADSLLEESSGPGVGSISIDRMQLDDIRLLLHEEMQTSVVPLVKETVREVIATSIGSMVADLILPLQESVDILVKNGVTVDSDKIATDVSSSLQAQLRASLSDNVKTVLIPTLESVTGQVLHQTACHLEKTNLDEVSKLESISKQLTTMTQLVVELTKEVSSLRSIVIESRASVPEPSIDASSSNGPLPPFKLRMPTPVVDPVEIQRAEILTLLTEGNYEQAFRTAVSNQTVEMTIYCCQNADMQQVFGGVDGQHVLLSQPILLCLMQQLGTVIVTSPIPMLELEWLQEISLSLNLADVSIQRHVPNVLQQVTTSINQRLTQNGGNNDPALRRPLQRMLQVMRGMQMGNPH